MFSAIRDIPAENERFNHFNKLFGVITITRCDEVKRLHTQIVLINAPLLFILLSFLKENGIYRHVTTRRFYSATFNACVTSLTHAQYEILRDTKCIKNVATYLRYAINNNEIAVITYYRTYYAG